MDANATGCASRQPFFRAMKSDIIVSRRESKDFSPIGGAVLFIYAASAIH
jgi:hypothetical protein